MKKSILPTLLSAILFTPVFTDAFFEDDPAFMVGALIVGGAAVVGIGLLAVGVIGGTTSKARKEAVGQSEKDKRGEAQPFFSGMAKIGLLIVLFIFILYSPGFALISIFGGIVVYGGFLKYRGMADKDSKRAKGNSDKEPE